MTEFSESQGATILLAGVVAMSVYIAIRKQMTAVLVIVQQYIVLKLTAFFPAAALKTLWLFRCSDLGIVRI